MPPSPASSRASIMPWPMSRDRPAPSARHMAISRRRATALASMRLATFAHATSSTSPTMPIRIISGVARLSRIRETPRLASDTTRRLSSTLRRNSALSVPAATSARMRSYTGSSPARACARSTPGRRRARTLSHVVLCPVHSHCGAFGCAESGIHTSTLSPGVSLANPRRADSDDDEGRAFQANGAADDGRVAAEASRPERVADHGHRDARRLQIVGGEQGPADRRRSRQAS